MRLSALFSDGMVLQRNQDNRIWGYTEPECKITGLLGEKTFEGYAEENGYFSISLPQCPVGGPYQLTIKADEEIVIQDVLVGDVFLLGGQSNMELPLSRTVEMFREELQQTNEPYIRMFEVPKEYEFLEERENVVNGSWIKASEDTLLQFSAVGYFTGKALKDCYHIPIGLIQTAVGGTPAKSWCCEETIRRMGYYIEELEQCKVSGYTKEVEHEELEREQEWLQEGRKAFSGTPIRTGTVTVPGRWNHNELSDFHGAIKLRKHFTVTREELAYPAEILLGTFIDVDVTYINGTYVGETPYQYPPRIYRIPEGVLKEGDNVVEVHAFVQRDSGGFMPGKQYCIRLGEKRDIFLNLAGTWEYEIMKDMPILPPTTFFIYKAAGMYNGMLSPVHNWKISAFLFYQGESDTEHPERYTKEMKALIKDWRNLWGENYPFVYVQLAGFSGGNLEEQGTEWAEFRAAQEKILLEENTAMACIYDVGEFNDLHPLDKKTVGNRIALCLKKILYKEDVLASGPVLSDAFVSGEGKVTIRFASIGEGLCTRENRNIVYGIELRDTEGNFRKANATIEGQEVIVISDGIKNPTGVRYAWKDCPMEANLYNRKGLPALPFSRVLG